MPDPSLATAAATTYTQMLRTALIPVTCAMVMMAALALVFGFFCGHALFRSNMERIN